MGSITPTEPGQTDIYDLSVGPVDPKEMTYNNYFNFFVSAIKRKSEHNYLGECLKKNQNIICRRKAGQKQFVM